VDIAASDAAASDADPEPPLEEPPEPVAPLLVLVPDTAASDAAASDADPEPPLEEPPEPVEPPLVSCVLPQPNKSEKAARPTAKPGFRFKPIMRACESKRRASAPSRAFRSLKGKEPQLRQSAPVAQAGMTRGTADSVDGGRIGLLAVG
jgi:hypothetical protein